MAKKIKQPPMPKEKLFSTATFSRLKGLAIAGETPKPELPTVVQKIMPNEDDTGLFLQAMEGTKKLGAAKAKNKEIAANVASKTTSTSAQHGEAEQSPDFINEIKRLKLEVTFVEQNKNEDELQPLSGNRLRQIKRGIVTVDAQLDLHGLTKDEAILELPRFLRSAQMRHEKAALIITGKGINSKEKPVLQQAVAGWLRDAGRHLVTEYAPAPPTMGGSGAFVVFLKTLKQGKI